MLLFAADMMFIHESEDNLQKYGFREKHQVRQEVVFYGTALEQIRKVNYLGYSVTYGHNADLTNKVNKFQHICGVLTNT